MTTGGHGGMILAVDPGDEHVGVAWFDKQEKGWACVLVLEMTPDDFDQYLEQALHSGIFRYFVYESWSLRRDMAVKMIGSEFETCQMIGMIKYVVKKVNASAHINPNMDREIELIVQSPKVKKATFAITAKKGYQSTADRLKVPAQHVRDAEIHGIHFIKHKLGDPMVIAGELWTEPPGQPT